MTPQIRVPLDGSPLAELVLPDAYPNDRHLGLGTGDWGFGHPPPYRQSLIAALDAH